MLLASSMLELGGRTLTSSTTRSATEVPAPSSGDSLLLRDKRDGRGSVGRLIRSSVDLARQGQKPERLASVLFVQADVGEPICVR